MKKLLILTIVALSAATIQAQPVVQNQQIQGPTWDGINLPDDFTQASLNAQGGNQPYVFYWEPQTSQNIVVNLDPVTGNYGYMIIGEYPASFQYWVKDATDNTSAPATVTITPGPIVANPENTEKSLK